jgi:low temperature requirement protein LtrA
MLLQPFLGYIHHRQYLAKQKPTAWTHLHVWYGRILILLGIINGGLGLKLASDTPAHSLAGVIVYSILAGVVGLMLLGLIFVVVTGRRQKGQVAGWSVQGQGS